MEFTEAEQRKLAHTAHMELNAMELINLVTLLETDKQFAWEKLGKKDPEVVKQLDALRVKFRVALEAIQ